MPDMIDNELNSRNLRYPIQVELKKQFMGIPSS